MKDNLKKSFEIRSVVCYFILIFLFLISALRIYDIMQRDYTSVQAEQSSYRVSIAKTRGTVFDRNMIPFTNTERKIMAVVSPVKRAITALSSKLSDEELKRVSEELKNGFPAVCELEKEIDCDGIYCKEVFVHNSFDMPASHIIGYNDASLHGVCGIEAAYDDLLSSNRTVDAVFTTDGKGRILSGISPFFENDFNVSSNYVVTTLDYNIQQTAQRLSSGLKKGVIIVADAKTSKIRAMVSKPDFEVTDIKNYLNDKNSPLLNRALSSYNVGSVFKPCVAAAAFESNMADFAYNCTGSTHIIDRNFNCHKLDGHGKVNLKKAIAYSCNTFFYNFSQKVGAEKIYKKARETGFGARIKIADGIYTSAGTLPYIESLENKAQLANFSIGQGKLTASPVCLLNLYCAIANKGCYYVPSVIEKTFKDGKESKYDIGSKTRIMSQSNAGILKEYLKGVIDDGTGKQAKPKKCTAAGKTATAQTGRYDSDKKEITNSWFCGFFPFDNPEYTVIVMSEGESDVSTASIFSKIADELCK